MTTSNQSELADAGSALDREALRLTGATKTFGHGATAVRALDDVHLTIGHGKLVVLLGPSGSGKTTLLNVIGGIDHVDSGSTVVDGQELTNLDRRDLSRFRRDHVAFVFQLYNLIPTLTSLENVLVIADLAGGERSDAVEALVAVGMGDHLDRFPSELSGGQQQRVAVARALAKRSPLLLCDEPTGALDRAAGNGILDLLEEYKADHGHTVVIVTHDETIAERADRVIRMLDGRIETDTPATAKS